jgi:hypothetical protein
VTGDKKQGCKNGGSYNSFHNLLKVGIKLLLFDGIKVPAEKINSQSVQINPDPRGLHKKVLIF